MLDLMAVLLRIPVPRAFVAWTAARKRAFGAKANSNKCQHLVTDEPLWHQAKPVQKEVQQIPTVAPKGP